MITNAYASAPEVRVCCPDEDCSMSQCLDMGCMSVANPTVPSAVPATPTWDAVRVTPGEASVTLPIRYQEIWTPPD